MQELGANAEMGWEHFPDFTPLHVLCNSLHLIARTTNKMHHFTVDSFQAAVPQQRRPYAPIFRDACSRCRFIPLHGTPKPTVLFIGIHFWKTILPNAAVVAAS
jgi:hypothetical protein